MNWWPTRMVYHVVKKLSVAACDIAVARLANDLLEAIPDFYWKVT